METMYVKVTIPSLPEEVRVSINSCRVLGTPEKTLAAIKRAARKRNVPAIYEMSSFNEYSDFRVRQKLATDLLTRR
jgi:hypothetical protein